MRPENDDPTFVDVQLYHKEAHKLLWTDALEDLHDTAMELTNVKTKPIEELKATAEQHAKSLRKQNVDNGVLDSVGVVAWQTLYDCWASQGEPQKSQARSQCILHQVPLSWVDGQNKNDYPTREQWLEALGPTPSTSHSAIYQRPTVAAEPVGGGENTPHRSQVVEARGNQGMAHAPSLEEADVLPNDSLQQARSSDLVSGRSQQQDNSFRLSPRRAPGDHPMTDAPSLQQEAAWEGPGDQQMTDAPSLEQARTSSNNSRTPAQTGQTPPSNPGSQALQKTSPVFLRITPKGKVFWTSACTEASTDDIEPARTLDGHFVVAAVPEKPTQKKAAIPRRKYVLKHKKTHHYFIQDESRCGGRTVGQLIAKLPVERQPSVVLTSLETLEPRTFLNRKMATVSVADKGAMEEYGVGVTWVAHDSEMWVNPASKPYRICSVWWRTEERKPTVVEDEKCKSRAVMNRALLDDLINKHLADHLCARALGGYSSEWEAYRELAGIQPALRGRNTAPHALTRVPHSQEALDDSSTDRVEHLRSRKLLENVQSAVDVSDQGRLLLKPPQAEADDIRELRELKAEMEDHKAEMKDLREAVANFHVSQNSYHGRDNVARASTPSGGARGSVMSDVQRT